MLNFKQSQRRRHGAPSGPWPFVDLDEELEEKLLDDPLNHIPLSASACEHQQPAGQDLCWCTYPQSLYPNWTPRQQQRSRVLDSMKKNHYCLIRYLDINSDGMFVAPPEKEVNTYTVDSAWVAIQAGRPAGIRLRMLFVDRCSGPVLQMIGTRYNVEPFYFSSTIGWIPCRFQSNVIEDESDHLTVIFTFIRSSRVSETTSTSTLNDSYGSSSRQSIPTLRPELAIDTQKVLSLRSSNICLMLDRLALYMVRSRTSGTIISLHPEKYHATTAEQLHTRLHLTGKSAYWCNIFKETSDPTFVLLTYLWYAVYAWDEALESLYDHIAYLELHAIGAAKLDRTYELHDIRAFLQYYTVLLTDFAKSVYFVRDTPLGQSPRQRRRRRRRIVYDNETATEPVTPNKVPSLHPIETFNPFVIAGNDSDSDSEYEPERLKTLSQEIMDRECNILLSEINRLGRSRHLMELRLKNVMALTFGGIEIDDNKQRQRLTEASLNDNAVMKQLMYLTMFFLPAGFCANFWSMNVTAFNPAGGTTLWEYFVLALPLMILSVYVIVACQLNIKIPQLESSGEDTEDRISYKELTFWNRVFWPAVLLSSLLQDMLRSKRKGRSNLSRPG